MAKKPTTTAGPFSNEDRLMQSLQRNTIALRAIELRMNEGISALRFKAEAEAALYVDAIQNLTQALEKSFRKTPPEDDAKSRKLAFGRIGTRAGRRSVNLLKPEAEVVAALEVDDNAYIEYPQPFVNKAAVLALGFELPGFIEITTGDDSFYADPDLDEIDVKKKAA